MQNIKIRAKLDKSGFQKELTQLLNKGYDLNLNSNNFKSVIHDITKELNKLKTTLNGVNAGNVFNITANSAKSTKAEVEKLANSMSKIEKANANLSKSSKSKLQSELDSLLGEVNNGKINIDLRLDGGSIKGILLELNKVKEQIGGFKILETGNSIIDGKTVSEFVKLEDSLGNIIRLTEKQGIIFRENLTPIQKLTKEAQRYEEQIYKGNDALEVRQMKLQAVLDGLYSRGNISEKQLNVTGLDSMISNLNLGSTGSDFEKINQILKEQLSLEKSIISARQQEKKEIANIMKEQLNLTDRVEKVKNNLQSKLNTAKSNNLIDDSVINNLQRQLDSINSNTAEKEILNLKIAISNLSSSDSGIVRVQQAIVRLEERINKIKNTKLDLMTSNELSELKLAENELEKLRSILASLKSGDVIDGKAISNQINIANNSVRGLEQSLDNLNVSSSRLSESMKNIFSYFVGGSVFYSLLNEFKEGVSSIIELDTALRDLRKTSNLSSEQLKEFTKTASTIGSEIGATTKSVITATEYYSKLGHAIDEAATRAKNATIFSNVADMSVDEASKALITIQKGFNLNTLEDMVKIMDVANEVGNNYSSSSKDVADGLLRMGNALNEAGNSYEQAVGIFVAGNASVQDADVVGNAIKTISMRLRGMETEIDETSVPVSKLRDEILQLTTAAGKAVDIMQDDNTFKSTYQQLTELAEIYPQLTDGQKAYLQYVIAGQQQGNIFSGIMANMKEGINAYETALNSANSSAKEQSIYIQSIEGRLNEFKNSITEIWINLINSDFIKNSVSSATWLINVLNDIIKTFGAMPTVITSVVGALTVFNKSFKENAQILASSIPLIGKWQSSLLSNEATLKTQISSIKNGISQLKSYSLQYAEAGLSTKGFGKNLLTLNGQLALTTTKLIATQVSTVALQAAMGIGLSLAISGCISLITKWIGSIETAEKKAQKLSEASQNMATAMSEYSDNSKLLSDYAKIKKQIDDISTAEKERNELNQELSSVKSQLANMDSQAYAILNNQNIPLERQLELLKHINDEKMREKALELEDSMGKQSEADAMAKDVQIYANTIRNLQDALSKGDGQGVAKILGVGKDFDDAKKAIDDYKAKIENLRADIDVWNSNVQMLKENNLGAELSYVELGDGIDDILDTILEASDNIDELGNSINDVGQESDDASTSVDRLSSVYESLGYSAKEAGDKIKELSGLSLDDQNAEIMKDATKAYSDSISEMVKLQDLIKDINEEGKLTPNIISYITSSYPEIGSAILDTGDTIDFLNGKIQEQEQIYTQALEIMVADDDKWYANHIANNSDMQNKLRELYNTFISDGADAYDIDLSNYQTLTQLKNALNDDLIDGLADYLKSFIGGNADTYKTDLRMKMRLYTVMYIENCLNC